jgi:tetratricopeptide (TPR) repeat protein
VHILTARNCAKLAVVVLAAMPLTGCTFFSELSAVRTFKDANLAYQRANYEEAIELYEEVLEVIVAGGDSELAGNLTPAYFYIANAYDSQFQPGLQDPENIETLDEAIKYYELAVDNISDTSLKTLSMQYLVAAFGSNKANDPSRAEPVIRAMILDDPENPDNYFRLAQLYEQAGMFDDAEAIYRAVQGLRVDDPIVYLQMAGFYSRAGEFDLTIAALEERAQIEPDNPEAFYTIATYYWEKAFRDFRITQVQKLEYVMAGIGASDRALALNERYVDALVYKNILLRMQANVTEDVDEQESLIAEADELKALADQLLVEQREGVAAAEAAEMEAEA